MIKYYGTQETGKHPSEAAEMTTFFGQLKKLHPEIHPIALHIRNEHGGNGSQIGTAKMQGGFIKGAPDIAIMGSPTFLCEMKSRDKKSKVRPEQMVFLENADKQGAFCCVAYGYLAALQAVEEWIKETPQ